MMVSASQPAVDLFQSLCQGGFKLSWRGDGALLVSPSEKLTDAQKEEIKKHKAELLNLVGYATLWPLHNRASYLLADLWHASLNTGSTVPMEEAVKALLVLVPDSRAADPNFSFER